MQWIIREKQKEESKFNAGSKARNDVDAILVNAGFSPLIVHSSEKRSKGIIYTARHHLEAYKEWKSVFGQVNAGDLVLIQYPVRNHTILMGRLLNQLHKRGATIIALIHDLESLRLAISPDVNRKKRLRYRIEEIPALKKCDKIIVHNAHMKKKIIQLFGMEADKMIELTIFDYLTPHGGLKKELNKNMPIVVAGNLSRAKSGYIYNLPKGLKYTLFGANYDGMEVDNIDYRGACDPDILPTKLAGSFGLVWDGPSAETCDGVFGEYLKYNNPHKASLYLAAGIPIIVWSESALADFVKNNNCGIVVNSLMELEEHVKHISDSEYNILIQSVINIQNKLLLGYNTQRSMSRAIRNEHYHDYAE